jgi:hypothetical protein
MPDLNASSPVLELDLSSFETTLLDTFANHEPNPTRAIERSLKQLIHHVVSEWASGSPYFISAEVRIPSSYNRQNKTLALLSDEGLNIWYLEVLTKWQRNIDFRSIEMRIKGLQLLPFTYGQGIQRTQNNYLKELKTQFNLKTTILHIVISPGLLRRVLLKVKDHQSFLIWDSSFLSSDRAHLLPAYINNITNEIHICECAVDAFSKSGGLTKKSKVVKNICHLCIVSLFGKDEAVRLYGAEFLSNQVPFVSQILLTDKVDHRTAMEEAARRFQTSKWKTEALLYAIVKELFANSTVLREFSPDYLEGLRIDIFVKEINLAIEYQGEQHFTPIEAFGGQEALTQVTLRDRKKKEICQQRGINILYFTCNETVTYPNVQRRLRKYLDSK